MQSIQNKFVMLILSCILLSATALGGIGVWYAAQLVETDSDEIMELTCKEQGKKIDMLFKGIETSVDMISAYTVEGMESVERFREDTAYRKEYTKELDRIFHSIAAQTDGAVAYYIRYSPEFVQTNEGFFYMRQPGKKFIRQPLTDLYAYTSDDKEHVGWYYIPAEAGEPVWLEPYLNKNINIYMISYVVPLYADGELIGVAGMDIDFGAVESWVDDVTVFKHGTAFLADAGGSILSRSSGVEEEKDVKMQPSLPLRLKKTVLCDLSNGMQLGLEVPVAELNQKKYRLIYQLSMIVLGLCGFFGILTTLLTRRMVRPLRELTKAAEQIAEGNMEIELKCSTKDEVYVLTKSIQKMISHLKEYITYINELAYRDSLTGVKNKTAYQETVECKKKEMEKEDSAFALVVMDVNGLKQINDTYGHEAGDNLLCNAVAMMEGTFRNSSIYRIGGDEFVVLLEGEDYSRAADLLDQLEKDMAETGKDPKRRVSIAWGIAVYDVQKKESYERLFQRADRAMYEKKARMKKG